MTTFEPRERMKQTPEPRTERGRAAGLEPKGLADLVLEAVRHVSPEELNPPVTIETSRAFQPRAMLAMLAYCYANGVYGSWDVEEVLREDPALRALCGRDYPDSRRFRWFRRNNHALLKRILEETLRGAWSLNHDLGCSGNGAPKKSSNGLLDMATQDWIAQEAERRIEKAMFIDQMSAEG